MTLYARLRDFRHAYQRRIATAVLVLIIAAFVVGQFVPSVTDLLLTKGVIAMLTLVLVLDLSISVAALQAGGNVHVSPDQDTDTPRMLELLRANTVKQADLLEYSAGTVEPLLLELKRQRAHIRVLIKHPETVGPHQRARIISQINTLASLICHDYDRAEVRCYRPSASLRGRKLGGLCVNVGWYTPDLKTTLEVRGHTNPVLTARLDTAEGQHLVRMLDGLFQRLWEAADTEDAMELRGRIMQ